MRKYLVAASVVMHVGVLLALFAAGIWRLQRLDPEKQRIDLAVSAPPPPAPSGSPAPAAQRITPKQPKHAVDHVVQPVSIEPVVPTTPAVAIAGLGSGEGSGDGTGSGSGAGSGDGPPGGVCTAHCDSGSAAEPVVIVTEPKLVPPTVLRALRTSGDTQVQAPETVRSELVRGGQHQLRAMFKLCIDPQGAVASVGMLHSSGFPAYDDVLVAAMRAWRYRPYEVNAIAVPACGVVTFVYSL